MPYEIDTRVRHSFLRDRYDRTENVPVLRFFTPVAILPAPRPVAVILVLAADIQSRMDGIVIVDTAKTEATSDGVVSDVRRRICD